ncbi:leucine-rich repeat extensin-like protein 2 [Dorcoceras hygrometricum]|uniref:Leucine-rich repeat extensin-like protein 2 n=1 Tax=Dorcoceras hygrometricum TaxID=472368 RepID=A0A2Z7CHK1_9LAMI|nr:leucine-rich repeat extensin-like protein 2 [Dorcoceras hygrometricum]
MRIRPPELETSVYDVKYHVSLSTGCVLGKWVCLVTLAMSLFDLQDVCIAIGSLATLDLPMVVDLIGIYVLKGPYCALTTTNWFLQALSVIPMDHGAIAGFLVKLVGARRQQEHPEPLGSLVLNGAGDDPAEFTPTDGEDI